MNIGLNNDLKNQLKIATNASTNPKTRIEELFYHTIVCCECGKEVRKLRGSSPTCNGKCFLDWYNKN